MDFDSFIELVARSGPADWNVETAPDYLQTIPELAIRPARSNAHVYVMAYRKNLSVTLAYGMLCRDDLKAEWMARFPDPHAAGRYLDFFYNSALVFRDVLVSVDGGQCVLPQPNPGPTSPYEVPRRRRDVARLVHQLTNPLRDFDDYFAHALFKPIDEHWPL